MAVPSNTVRETLGVDDWVVEAVTVLLEAPESVCVELMVLVLLEVEEGVVPAVREEVLLTAGEAE